MNQLLTTYGASINPENVLQEYPRPQLRRNSYLNLNGYWSFSMSKDKSCQTYDKKILVPFSPESLLSGVKEILYPNMYAHYKKDIKLPLGFMKDKLMIHFGAVDQTSDIYINDVHVYQHIGGYVPFSIDITNYVEGDSFVLKLVVSDLSDTSYHLTGKQRINHEGIFYTPQSGIWQTVWLESVSKDYIKDLVVKPIYHESAISIDVISDYFSGYHVRVFNQENKLIKTQNSKYPHTKIFLDDFIAWTPENPYLYHIEIIHGDDDVKTYVGMRHFERKADEKGVMRFYLNDQPYFQSGVLDQGYFSDGLLTPPSDQAMIDDITTMKKMGFNMLRKHIKIEPLRWYYHCDRIGMLVWQDMLSGSEHKNVVFHHVLSIMHIHLNDRYKRLFGRKHIEGKKLYEKDLNIMLDYLKNVVSLCVWVPFNEAWGQFDTIRITKKIKDMDKQRLVDHASGWSDQRKGDFYSRHIYYQPIKFYKRLARKRIAALTEYGGYSMPIENHRYNDHKLFGYKTFNHKKDLEVAITQLFEKKLIPNLYKGLSALVYTQLSDVEDEVNGFITYDRKVLKIETSFMKKLNEMLFNEFNKITK